MSILFSGEEDVLKGFDQGVVDVKEIVLCDRLLATRRRKKLTKWHHA